MLPWFWSTDKLLFDFLSGPIEISIALEAFLRLSVSIFSNDFINVFKILS